MTDEAASPRPGCAPPRLSGSSTEAGQASILLLGVIGALVVGALVLVSFSQALGAKSRHQRAADLAAVSAAQAMRDAYPRLFEPPDLEPGVANPRHLDRGEYLAIARAAALRGARRNGVPDATVDVDFPDGDSFAPTRVRVRLRADATARAGERTRRIVIRASATAELAPRLDAMATGGGYNGPLAYRQGKPMRPDVALAFDRMERAAAADGIRLIVVSGYRSDAEQAELYRRHPDPRWVAPPGRSLHRLGTELDLGPRSAYGWLGRNSRRFGFVRRYAWEPWHYGYAHNACSRCAGGGGDGRGASALPSFVPARYRTAIVTAAQRWNVSAALLSAQIYVESNFNPFARSPAGALGIAQFMPGTARALGLRNPLDPTAAIDAQAHLMRDLLRRFASVPLALAAYNAGPGRVAACMCIPPIAETRGYVARILGLLGGAGEAGAGFDVRLVE